MATFSSGLINSANLADNLITNAKMADDAIKNAEVASDAAIVYSKLSLTGSIVNADLNASAAIARTKMANMTSQGVDKTTTFATTSTTFVDITDLTTTLTTAAVPHLIFSSIAFSSSVDSTGTCNLLEDSTSLSEQGENPHANAAKRALCMMVLRTPSAASHTYKSQVKTDTGTITVNAASQTSHLGVVELR